MNWGPQGSTGPQCPEEQGTVTRSRLGAQTRVLGPLPLSSQTRPRKFLDPWKPQLVL